MKNLLNLRRGLKALGACAVAALAFIMPQNVMAQADKKIGIQLYSVMGAMQKDPVASIERLAGMGYRACELVQWGGDPKVFGMEAPDFKALCDKNGIEIISTHSSIQEEPGKEEEIMNRWRKLFEVQKACGGKYFVIPSYKVDYTVADVQRMCDYFNRVGKIAAEYRLKLGYQNHSAEYKTLEGTNDVMWEYLVEHTDPQYVFFELDVYWCSKGGKDPVAYLKKYPNRIQMLHIKDEFVIGESGDIDFKAIFDQFYKNGMKDYVVEIEMTRDVREKAKTDNDAAMDMMFEAARKSAEYLKKADFVK